MTLASSNAIPGKIVGPGGVDTLMVVVCIVGGSEVTVGSSCVFGGAENTVVGGGSVAVGGGVFKVRGKVAGAGAELKNVDGVKWLNN